MITPSAGQAPEHIANMSPPWPLKLSHPTCITFAIPCTRRGRRTSGICSAQQPKSHMIRLKRTSGSRSSPSWPHDKRMISEDAAALHQGRWTHKTKFDRHELRDRLMVSQHPRYQAREKIRRNHELPANPPLALQYVSS